MSFRKYKRYGKVIALRLFGPAKIPCGGVSTGYTEGEEGDYLVIYDDGGYIILGKDRFESEYEETKEDGD